jgi:hypothetical protein
MEKRGHKSSRTEEMASPSRRRKHRDEEDHFWNDIDRKADQKKNCVLNHHRSVDGASHKVNIAEEDKMRRDLLEKKNKTREMIRAENFNQVSGHVEQQFVWYHNLFCPFVTCDNFSSS